MYRRVVDKPFLVTALILALLGFFIFVSASLGLLARAGGTFSAIAVNQAISLAIGLIFLYTTTKIPYRFWNRYAFYILLISIGLTLLVFVPSLGFEHAGARRWLSLGTFSFQPAELLKIAFIIYFATWLAGVRQKVQTARYGIVPLLVLLIIVGTVLIAQPDLGTFLVIAITGFGMLIAAGGKWRHTLSLGLIAAVGLFVLGLFKPYVKTRLLTFINPASDPLGAGYQIQQSLIAIGSGQWFGRGFGQSVQKFNFLPEPVGDSIFAVFAEEWGFIGAGVLIALFLALVLRGFKIAARAPTIFSRLLVTGIVMMIAVQSFINIASMLGIFPLTGMPLLFVSQGGSALIMTLAAVGIVLHVSKYRAS